MLKSTTLVITLLTTQVAQAELPIPALSTKPLNVMAAQDQTLARAGLTYTPNNPT